MATFTLPGGQVVDASGGEINRLARASMLRKQMQDFPGRAPGGSGPTGLLSNDAQGWSNMLNEQSELANLTSDEPLSVKHGGFMNPTFGQQSDVSTIGPGQTSAVFPGALEGLQAAYKSSQEGSQAQARAAAELGRRFPGIYGNKRGY